MGRFLWSQLLHRKSRTATLGLGILVAAVGFTMLTSAANTSALEIRGTIAQNFRSAYDILVRPSDSYTPLERADGLVRPNYLSGLFGGITLDQWHDILQIPGVEVAAPVANVGYILLRTQVAVPLGRFDLGTAVQLYRVHGLRLANNGTSRYPTPDSYLYVTRRHRFTLNNAGETTESVPGSPKGLGVCSGFYQTERMLRDPFDLNNSEQIFCHSDRSPAVLPKSVPGSAFAPGEFGILSDVTIPVLLAAIDPRQESRLVGLDGAMVAGRFLGETEGPRLQQTPDAKIRVIPLIASTKTFVDEALRASVERLDVPGNADVPRVLASSRAKAYLDGLRGTPEGSVSVSLAPTYRALLNGLTEPPRFFTITYDAYRTVSQVTYRSQADGLLAPEMQSNPLRLWKSAFLGGYFSIPTENEDAQFRQITLHAGSNSITEGVADLPQLQVIGRFDPERIRGFSNLSTVPLESYVPPELKPGDARSRSALGGGPLLPTLNVGGYIQQPPLAFTTLDAARPFWDPSNFSRTHGKAPISVIRIRVAGVTGPDPVSLAKIKQVALAIQERTELAVDITAGSSPKQVLIDLPAGTFGQPPLTVRESWVKKGVAVVILNALDRKSVALFVLVLVVTGLFLVNGALASVKTRRAEIGTLLALGWTRERVFRAVLGELALVGLAAGVVGTAIAALLVTVFDFQMPVARTLLVAPVATVLAALAGLPPAWRAARGLPLDAVRPAVAERGTSRRVHTIAAMALSNLRRLPARTLLGAAGLVIGTGALALLLSITLAFRGSLVGTALGKVISIQVRWVDYLGVFLALGLAALSVTDVLFLNLRERAPELVTLRASGWRGSHLARLVALEGLGIGVLGSVAGTAVGVALSSVVGVSGGGLLGAAGIALSVGIAVALAGSLVPASLISRMTAPTVLAEE